MFSVKMIIFLEIESWCTEQSTLSFVISLALKVFILWQRGRPRVAIDIISA